MLNSLAVRPIETDRLILRVPLPSDVDALGAIFGDPVVMRSYLSGKPFSTGEIRRMLPAIYDHHATYGFGALTMCLKASETIVGLTGLSHMSLFKRVQLGWVLDKAYWGRGFAFESGTALLAHAFESVGLDCVEATTRTDNATAIATIEKLGMEGGARFCQDGIELVSYRSYCALTLAPGGRVSN